ncbi:hypothetical protein N0V90_009575 [Kalmusia sp. IMI 367209]|nr:hypothetical protein N0V90_009575 [Kalmusia sp. IMI 367209]
MARIDQQEMTITVGNIEYFLVLHNASFFRHEHEDLTLILVYPTKPGQTVSGTALQKFRNNVLEHDDVFHSDFYHILIFYGSGQEDIEVKDDALEEIKSWHTKEWHFVKGNDNDEVPSGPISVKDNFDIEGHKTTLCNRSWEALYPPSAKTAASVQTLIDAGAVIVGKVKLQAMIMREEPLEAVEFTAPFNPRADGYQVPSGSSHGSAAGIGSYDWLDFSLGSDKNFIKGLEIAYNVKRTQISLAKLWKNDLPDGAENSDFKDYLELAGAYPYYHDSYRRLERFRKDHEETFGKPPFVHRPLLWQLEISKNITLEQRDHYWRRSEIYRKWLLDKVFDAENKEIVTIMVLPIELGLPNYRDAVPPPFALLPGWAPLNMSPMARAPELTAPCQLMVIQLLWCSVSQTFIFNAVNSKTPEQMWYALWISIFKVLGASIALTCACGTFLPAFWKSVFSRSQDLTLQTSSDGARGGPEKELVSDEALMGRQKFDGLPELSPVKMPRSNQSHYA